MSAERYVISPAATGLLLDLGISAANVLRRASLPADVFTRTPVTMPPDEYYAFWVALQEEADDPNLPITIARALRVEVFQPPIFAALCSPNLAVAAQRIATHKRLVGPLRLTVDHSADGLTIGPQWPPDSTPPAVLVTWELLFWVALARIATRAEVRLLRVATFEPPADRDAYRDYLGVAIEPGRTPSITFSPLDAVRPFLTADEGMWEFFEPELRRRLSELNEGAAMAERVRAALLELLPAGESTMQVVARHFAVSMRTLQRRLRDEQTSFQAVLNATRESLARHYLTESTMPAAEISFLLGYQDTNSFYRAFQSWTGQTPQQVRAGQA
ncbi:MAG TPA: AraC family transcriptional regulator ligand-binding domain-containing protein [Actinomycetes bacterium]|jgi:AraC-like DNA-binding protein|nr:AraC family transcriptional regulator ligand-binding domain-containing protein [Actinomycetes bacterium]